MCKPKEIFTYAGIKNIFQLLKIFLRINRIVSHGLLLNPPQSLPLLTLAWNIAIPLDLPVSISRTDGMQYFSTRSLASLNLPVNCKLLRRWRKKRFDICTRICRFSLLRLNGCRLWYTKLFMFSISSWNIFKATNTIFCCNNYWIDVTIRNNYVYRLFNKV